MLCCAHVAHVLIRNRFDSDNCLDVLARAANHYAALLACLCRLGDPQWDGSWDARSPYGVTGGNGGWRGIVIPIVARQEGRDVSFELGIGGFRPRRWWQRLFGLGWDRAQFHVFVREAASEKEVATGKEAALQWLHALPWPVQPALDGND